MANYIEKEKLINEISKRFKGNWEIPCSSRDKTIQDAICIVYEIIRKQPIEQIFTCKDCVHNKVCQEIEELQQREHFTWYSAERGCPYFESEVKQE